MVVIKSTGYSEKKNSPSEPYQKVVDHIIYNVRKPKKMLLRSEFYIHKENEDVLEFREKQSTLYVSCLIDISIFLVSFIGVSQIVDVQMVSLFLIGVGGLALAHGIGPLIIQRKIAIDKNKLEILFTGGIKRFFLRSELIKFSQVRHIVIKETYESSRGENEFSGGKDRIYLALKGRRDLKIEDSCGDIYTNEFTRKLAETIGCQVVSLRF